MFFIRRDVTDRGGNTPDTPSEPEADSIADNSSDTASTDYMELFTLGNVVIFGDSWSTFEGYIPEGYATYYYVGGNQNTDVTRVEETWWHQLFTDTESTLLLNSSYSGSTLCSPGFVSGVDRTAHSFITRLDELVAQDYFTENHVDTVLILGATNDSGLGVDAGKVKYSDWTQEDLSTVLPAFCYMVDTLQTKIPGVRIINIVNYSLKPEIIAGYKAAGEHYGIETVELTTLDRSSDHPNVRGMRQIKDQLVNYLTERIRSIQ